MHPVLFKVGPITIYTYGAMMATAFLVCYFILRKEIKRIGDDPDFASNILFRAVIGGIVGAKVFYLLENFSSVLEDPIGMIFSGAGLVFHGGLIGGTIAVVALIKKTKRPLGMYADIIGPILLIGQAIGRIGCFSAGCCHGMVCNSFVGVRFPGGSPASFHQFQQGLLESSSLQSLPVYPTQLFEAGFNIIFFFILTKLIRPRLRKYGSTFSIYLIAAGTERFFLEFIRVNPKVLFGLTIYQFSSLALILAGIIILLFFVKVEKPNNG